MSIGQIQWVTHPTGYHLCWECSQQIPPGVEFRKLIDGPYVTITCKKCLAS